MKRLFTLALLPLSATLFNAVSFCNAEFIINNKTVVSLGGPGIRTVQDRYNQDGDWNRTYSPFEPQQVHASWLSDGKAFRVQFSTMAPVKKASLKYWINSGLSHKEEKEQKHKKKKPTGHIEDAEQDAYIVDQSHSWTFVDGGEAQHTQYMHTLSTETLKPATIYSYRIITIGDDGESSEGTDNSFESKVFELHTPAKSSKGSSSFKFIATGDIGVNNAVSMPLFKQFVTSHEYDFVAFVGDQGYNLDDFNGTKGDEYMKFAEELYANLPILTTTGNHEQAYNFSHYKNRFDLMPYRESGFDNALQYSINYKNLHLVSFDTEVFFEGSEEEVLTALHWLEEDLIEANKRRSKVPWIIVFGHRPLYCSVMSSSDCVEKAEKLRFGEPVDKNYGLETLLSRYKVDLYLCGHKHNYERSYPVLNNTLVTTSYHNPPSFFQVITGNGGNYEGCDKFDDMTNTAAIPKWLGNHYEGYGFTTVEVSRNRLDLHHYEVQEDGTLGDLRDQVRVHKTKGHVKKQAKLAAEAA